jgi:hypothetical protein
VNVDVGVNDEHEAGAFLRRPQSSPSPRLPFTSTTTFTFTSTWYLLVGFQPTSFFTDVTTCAAVMPSFS